MCHDCTCFIPERGKITSLVSKNTKRTAKNTKNYPMLQICYSGNAKHSGKVAHLPMSDLWSISAPPKNITKSLILMCSDGLEREHWLEMGS